MVGKGHDADDRDRVGDAQYRRGVSQARSDRHDREGQVADLRGPRRGSASENIKNIRRISTVMKDGQIVDRQRLPLKHVLTAARDRHTVELGMANEANHATILILAACGGVAAARRPRRSSRSPARRSSTALARSRSVTPLSSWPAGASRPPAGGAAIADPAGRQDDRCAGKFMIPGLMDANVHLVLGSAVEFVVSARRAATRS